MGAMVPGQLGGSILAAMYTGLKHLHSTMAYVVLLFVLIAVLHAILSLRQKRPFTPMSKKFTLYGLIAAHVQLLAGLVIYFMSPIGLSGLSGGGMGNSAVRFFALEHPLMMIIGIALITVGYSKAKRTDEAPKKFKAIAWFYGIGLLLFASRIPWGTWL